MNNPLIVIGRQFGSGGRRIGKLVAERLGIGYYDTEILAKAAREVGINPEVFQIHDEKKPSGLRTLLQGLYGLADNFHTVGLSGERIYNEQGKVIRDICKKGGCVIVGRTADLILHDDPRLFSVFLHSPLHVRAEMIHRRGDAATQREAEEMASREDRRREAYYNFYRGEKKWGAASTYHLTVDTSHFTHEEVADLIITLAKKKYKDCQKSGLSRRENGEESPGNTGHHAS